MQLIIKPGVYSLVPVLVLILLILNGCAGLQQGSATEEFVEIPEIKEADTGTTEDKENTVDTAAEKFPANELTPDLLYDLLLAEFALQNDEYDLAFDKYYQAAKQTRDSRLVKKATRVTLFSKNDAQTNKSIKLWSELQPDNLDVQQIYASTLISQKNDQQALENLQRVIELSENYSQGLKRCVAILDTIPERERVDYLYAQLTKTHENQAIVHLYASKIAMKYGDYETAEQSLEKASVLDPDDLQVQIVQVELLQKLQRDEEAIKLLQNLLKEQPDNTEFRLELARMLAADKQNKKAFKQIQILARNDELSPEILFAIGLLSMEINEMDAAKQYLERLHGYRLYTNESAYFIGQLETVRKNYPEAEQWFRQVKQGQYVYEASMRLALVLSLQGKLNDAIALLNEYQPANLKQSIEILQIKAEVYAQTGKYKAGYDVYTEALDLSPDNPDLLYARAMVAEKFGRIDLLEKDLLAIIAENPQDNQALNALGFTLAEHTERYQEAKSYIEQALAIDGEDIATLDSMGWILHKLGHNEEAAKYLQKAYEKDPDPEIAAHYGEVLWLLGDTRKAEKVWNKALKEHPEHKILLSTTSRYLK